MNYLRIWLMLLALFFGWFHMARGHDPVQGNRDIPNVEHPSFSLHIDTGFVQWKQCLSAEDVRRLIDSAFHVRDTAGQYDTLLFFSAPCHIGDTLVERFTTEAVPPDSCMTVDTVWCSKDPQWVGGAPPKVALMKYGIHSIDTIKTEGPCDD